jgi:hypothetical protein
MMKYLITYSKGDLSRQLSLRDTFDSLAQACGGSIRYNEAALVEVDDPLLGEALERICRAVGVPCEIPGNGCAPQRIAEAPEPVSASVSVETPSSDPEHPAAAEPDGSSASLPVCPYCHEPFEPKTKRRKICGKPECQRAYNREYQARLYAAKKAQDEAPDTGKAGTPVSPQDPFEIVSEEFVPRNSYGTTRRTTHTWK